MVDSRFLHETTRDDIIIGSEYFFFSTKLQINRVEFGGDRDTIEENVFILNAAAHMFWLWDADECLAMWIMFSKYVYIGYAMCVMFVSVAASTRIEE